MKRITFYLITICYISIAEVLAQTNYCHELSRLYIECTQDTSQRRKYLDLFPESGELFISTFGFKDSVDIGNVLFAPLYDGYQYIQMFYCFCDSLPNNENLQKIITLATQLEWEVDAISHFQSLLLERLRDLDLLFTKNLLSLLKTQPPKNIIRFFTFCLDGPIDKRNNHCLNKDYEILYKFIENDSCMINLLNVAYQNITLKYDV